MKTRPLPIPSCLTKCEKALKAINIAAFLMFCCVPAVFAGNIDTQEAVAKVTSTLQAGINLKGVVTDAAGIPIIGASIRVKGTTTGTTTDMNGQYTLTVPAGATIEISYIGYVTQEIAVGNRTNINIQLVEENQLLDEVVVIGYGAVKKSDLTGSVASVSARQFKDEPITRVEDALQGRLAGVDVQTMSGAPGSEIKIRVRGAGSINKSNDPLYVVDGVIGVGLEGMNTADIASIEVLKDASSTAIYGSRGANGVILITTRKGSADRKQITFDAELGITTLANRYDLLDAYEYAQALNDVKGAEIINATDMAAYQNGSKGIDWQDLIFQTGVNQNYKVSLSGGNRETQYFVSGNVLDQKGITLTSTFKRYSFRTNITSQITNWLDLNADVRLSHTEAHNNSLHNGNKGNIIWLAINYSPTMELMNSATGKYNKDPYNSINDNPYGLLMDRVSDRLANRVNALLDLKFKILKGLTFSVLGGVNYSDSKGYGFSSQKVVNTNSMSNSDNYFIGLQNTNNLTYTNRWGDHSLTATGVFEIATTQSRGMGISGTALLTESVGYWNVGLASNRSESNSYSESALMSGVGRVMYNYKNKYNATLTFRADGSSKFTKNKWGYFPSGAVAWNIVEENFMKEQDLFQQLKLRASYGIIGNEAIGSYETLGLLSSTKYSYGSSTQITGYWGNSFASPDLTWEKTKQVDIGLDIRMLDQRLGLTIDWYLKNTEDALLQKNIPRYNGGGRLWVNQGKIKNTGFELSIDGDIIRNNDLRWNSVLNASYLKNEVVDLAGDAYLLGDQSITGDGLVSPAPTIVMPGHPLGSLYGYTWEGIDANGNNKFTDFNNSGTVDSEDLRIIGKSTPDMIFGWNNTVTYKNWEFNLFFNAAVGADKFNLSRFTTAVAVGESRFVTLREAYYDGFDKVGAGAKYASLKSTSNVNFGNSTQWLESADYVRLKNMSIAYTLPKSLTHFANIRLAVSCQNIFTLTPYQGMDPEAMSGGGNVDTNGGIDIGAYPLPRTFTFGVRFDF